MGIMGIMKIFSCQHVNLSQFEWLCTTDPDPPSFKFQGMPRNGTIVLSRWNIQVVCDRCHLDEGQVIRILP